MHILPARIQPCRQRFLYIPIFLVMTGCWPSVSVPNIPHGLDVSGRLMLTTTDEKRRADFRFTEYEDYWKLKIWGRFGVGRVTLTGTEGSVVVKDAAGNSTELEHFGDEHLREGLEVLLSRGVRDLLILREHDDEFRPLKSDPTWQGSIGSRIDVVEETQFDQWIVAKRLRFKHDDLELLVLVDEVQLRN